MAEEGLDNDTLMSLLKEKAKELKQSQKKLKKVEDKFVEMHKSQKNLMNDRETFIQFLHLVFPQSLLEEEIMLMPEGAEGFGMFDFNHIRQFWTLTKQNQENEHLAMMETMQDQKKIMAQKILEYEEQLKTQPTQSASPGDSSDVEKLRQDNNSLKDQIKNLQNSQSSSEQLIKSEQKYLAEIKDLEQKIRSLQAENSEIKAKELISTIQSQGLQGSVSAMPQIDHQKQIDELKQQLSNKTNQILQLQEDKEELESKLQSEVEKGEMQKTVVSEQVKIERKEEIDEDGINQQLEGLKTDLKDKDEQLEKKEKYNKELESKLQKLLMDFAQMRTKAQEMLVKKDQEIKKFKQKLGQDKESPSKKGDVHQMDINSNNSGIESDYSDSDSDEQIKEAKAHRNKNPQFEQIDQTSRAYIKNILLKYLEYQAEGLQKETKMMEKVLFTVLKVHEKDIKELQEARLTSYNSGIMSYIWAAEESDLVAHPVKPRAFNPGEKKSSKNKSQN